MDDEIAFTDEILENTLGHMRLENLHGALLAVHGGSPLLMVAIFVLLLPLPSGGLVVVLPHAIR